MLLAAFIASGPVVAARRSPSITDCRGPTVQGRGANAFFFQLVQHRLSDSGLVRSIVGSVE